MTVQRLVVGITGASGAIYGLRVLKALREIKVETHLVISRSGQITVAHELDMSAAELAKLADEVYRVDDIGAAISSGSFRTIIPKATSRWRVAPC